MIEAFGLKKYFGHTKAVDGIDFSIGEGEIVGFLGPNGAGKTTTIRMLTCYLPPTSGTAKVAGYDIVDDSMSVRGSIGYLPENVPLYPEMRVIEYLRFRGALKGLKGRELKARVEEVMDVCGVSDVRRKLVGHVSRGYRQRVALAEALVSDPPILILDEPTTGLDPNQRRNLKELVKSLAEKHTILFSSHVLAEVEQVCTRVMIIHKGRIIAQGTKDELVKSLAGRRTMRVTANCPAEDLLNLVSTIPGCGNPRMGNGENEFVTVEAELEAGSDPGLSIFKWARDNGWLLKEISFHSSSLEEIFARLTREEGE